MTLLERYRAGDIRALARLVSLVEDGDPAAEPALAWIADQSRRTRVVGLTGPPGAGKSSLAGALVGHWRAAGRTVAVLAIDPSSPRTGGATLGDRVRMGRHFTDAGVFIRSMAARGWPGGLAAAAEQVVALLAGFGFDEALVETVGVGQGEHDIARLADVVVVAQAPGAGDEIQAIKAGLLEIADVIAVTKADQPGAAGLAAQLRSLATPTAGAGPPVVLTSATTGVGIAELATILDAAPGTRGGAVTPESAAAEALRVVLSTIRSQLAADPELGRLGRLIAEGEVSTQEAAEALLSRVRDRAPS